MAEPLHKRIQAAWLLGAGFVRYGGGMSTRAWAEEPMIVLVAHQFGRAVKWWRGDMQKAVGVVLVGLAEIALILFLTWTLPLTGPLIALRCRHLARKEVASRTKAPDIPGASPGGDDA